MGKLLKLEVVKGMLEETGFEVAYRFFKTNPLFPFIVYICPYDKNFAADGKAYHSTKHIQIELYTEIKDLQAEEKVEEVLNRNEIYFEKTENYIDSESMYQIVYEIEI